MRERGRSRFFAVRRTENANKSRRSGLDARSRPLVSGFVLQGVVAALAGADLDDVLDVIEKNLPVADMAGVQGFLHGLDQRLDRQPADHDIDLDLG